ncbi:SMODS-associated NUDIX domain-containing protein [Streptomyces sp. H62]
MVEKIVGGLVLAILTYLGRTLWQNRRHLGLMLVLLVPWRRTRVSVAVLLRVHDEDRYVLFSSPTRPGAFGPPGGVVKYQEHGRAALERMEFEFEDRGAPAMRLDLRGYLPASRVPGFARWLHRGIDREHAAECLRRELVEELGEVGHEELAPLARDVTFRPVRRVVDGPMKVAGETYHQLRFIEVLDLVPDRPEAVELRTALLSLAAAAPDGPGATVVTATRKQISLGRAGVHVVLPQSAFLVGDRRFRGDIHPAT